MRRQNPLLRVTVFCATFLFIIQTTNATAHRRLSSLTARSLQKNPRIGSSSIVVMGQQKRTEEKRLAAEDQEPLLKARGGEAMEATSVNPLTKLRTAMFPIYGSQEVTKFLLLGSIKFFIILALTLTRDTKDTLVVTQCGAEAIAFLKVSYMIPLQMRHFDAFKP